MLARADSFDMSVFEAFCSGKLLLSFPVLRILRAGKIHVASYVPFLYVGLCWPLLKRILYTGPGFVKEKIVIHNFPQTLRSLCTRTYAQEKILIHKILDINA